MTALLLLALALGGVAAGVLIGRYYVPDDRLLKRKARHADSYAKAINLLLERDRDGAVAELVNVVAENVDDVEPYFALGALFRNRGEWERAIRVHQAIELRQKNNHRVCLRARYQLGLDFRAAGMPRRATKAMEDCLEEDTKHQGAMAALGSLYEEQGRYAEAASAWTRLYKLEDRPQGTRPHHLLCAAAQRSIEHDDLHSAKQYLKEAAKCSDVSAHFLVSSAELAAAKGEWTKSSDHLKRALAMCPSLVSYLAGPLRAAQIESHRDDTDAEVGGVLGAAEVLKQVDDEVGGAPLLALAAAELSAEIAEESANQSLQMVIENYPDLLPARVASARLSLLRNDPEELREQLESLVGEHGLLESALDGYWACGECGHSDPLFFWRCPQCRQWGSATLDTSTTKRPPVSMRRERRNQNRAEGKLLSGDSLPTSLIPYDATQPSEESASTLGRAGKWLSSAFGSVRGTRKKSD